MKSSLYKLSLFAVLAGALAIAPMHSEAQEKKKDPAAEKPAGTPGDEKKAPNPNRAIPFRGKVDAVDKAAKTVKVGERVFHVTAETRFEKNGKAATLDDAVVGEAIRGSARKTEDGTLNAVSMSFGAKPEGEAPAKAAPVEKPTKKEKDPAKAPE